MFLLLLVIVSVLSWEPTLMDKPQTAQIIDQPPPIVETRLGSSLILECSFEPANLATVKWFFQPNNSLNCNTDHKTLTIQSDRLSGNQTNTSKIWSKLNLSNVSDNDSGYYFCQVNIEIPRLQTNCSNGTRVIVSSVSKMESSTSSLKRDETVSTPGRDNRNEEFVGWILWVAVAAGSAIVVTMSVVVFWILCRQRPNRSRENAIYANTRVPRVKQPSPRPSTQDVKENIRPCSLLTTQAEPWRHEYQRSPRR